MKARRLELREAYSALRLRLGKRGTALLIFGLIWVCTGVSVLVSPSSASYILLEVGTVPRAIAWISTGIIAVMAAGRPQGEDAVGFLALYVMAAYRVAAYATGVVLWVLPGGDGGNLRGLVGALAWATIVAFIVLIAGWQEPAAERPEDIEATC